jgi:crotonobetainyl-CoA:carnitine CoA-transferase CaiB-like acyl-CoA transferase
MEEHSEAQPLSDLRVIDLTHGIAGPYCTKLLADFGADIIKVERPGSGDYARALGPFPDDIPHPEKSGLFLFLNTNKRGIILDLKTADGADALKELVKGADILVESFKPGVMEKLGLGYETLSSINPNLVMTSVSNFGQTGPYRDYLASEITLYGMGGRMSASGLPEQYPIKLGGNHVQYQAGNNAAMATLFASHACKRGGIGGQHIDVSIFETQMASINGRLSSLVNYQYNGERGRRRASTTRGSYPNGHYPCRDGYISVSGGGQRWPLTVAALEMPELLEDPRFAPPMGQQSTEGREEFEKTIWLPWLMARTKQQVIEQCQEHGLLIGANNSIDAVMDANPQLDFRKYFVEIDHPIAGKLRYPGAPIFTDEGWWEVRRPAPTLGQHNQDVLEKELGLARSGSGAKGSGESGSSVNTNGAATAQGKRKTNLPLEGVRIIDMTVIFAGPYGTMFLADMGAEVIRVETLDHLPATSRGAFARPSKESQATATTSPYPNRDPGERPWNRAANFNAHSRNKYGMTAELSTDEGKDIFRRLVEVSDLFIENNAAGSMARLGVSYETVHKWNPRLIMISICGFGQTGPWNYYRGIGSQFEAAVGHASVTGYPGMGSEGVPSSVATDASSGVTVALAALMALKQRERTGRGMFIDISLGENFMPHLGEFFMDYTINGRVASSSGNRDHLGLLVQGAYPCTGDDEWIAISLGKIEDWRNLCRLMERPELAEDGRFKDMGGLRAHHDDIDRIIGEWTTTQDNIALFHRLQKEGVAAGPLMHEIHVFNDPHLKERDFFVSITAPEVGTYLYPSTTYKMSKIPFKVRKPSVRLGEDNDYVYREVLGLSEEEYDLMKSLGHVGMDYAPHVK